MAQESPVPLNPDYNSVATPIDDSAPPIDADAAQLQRAAVRTPVTPKHRYIHLRSFATQWETQRGQAAANSQLAKWGHIRPDSVLICPMGYYWAPGSWQKVVDMMIYTQQQGVYVAMSELQDRCFQPYDALGTMRNEAAIIAMNEGFEWLLYLDNDVQPERDTLLRMLHWQMPIISPFVAEPGNGRRLFGPTWEPNQGLKPAKWVVLSMLMFRTNVFNCVGTRFWSDAIGADEGYHFQTLWRYGHHPWIDTNTQLVTAGGPHYPLSSNRMNAQQRRELWERLQSNRRNPPDRTIVAGADKGKTYLPFTDNPLVSIRWDRLDLPLVDDGLTYEQRQMLHDFEIRLRNDPPNRVPVTATDNVVDGEYLPFAGEARAGAQVEVKVWQGG